MGSLKFSNCPNLQGSLAAIVTLMAEVREAEDAEAAATKTGGGKRETMAPAFWARRLWMWVAASFTEGWSNTNVPAQMFDLDPANNFHFWNRVRETERGMRKGKKTTDKILHTPGKAQGLNIWWTRNMEIVHPKDNQHLDSEYEAFSIIQPQS
jgi:hypothetical protein